MCVAGGCEGAVWFCSVGEACSFGFSGRVFTLCIAPPVRRCVCSAVDKIEIEGVCSVCWCAFVASFGDGDNSVWCGGPASLLLAVWRVQAAIETGRVHTHHAICLSLRPAAFIFGCVLLYHPLCKAQPCPSGVHDFSVKDVAICSSACEGYSLPDVPWHDRTGANRKCQGCGHDDGRPCTIALLECVS